MMPTCLLFAILETGKPKSNCWTLHEVRAGTQTQQAASLAWVFLASWYLYGVQRGAPLSIVLPRRGLNPRAPPKAQEGFGL